MSNAEMKKGKHVYEVTDLQLLPSQADLRRRATYRLAASGQKRRRTTNENIGSLSKICGIEHAMFCHHPEHPLDAKPLQFISAPGLLACILLCWSHLLSRVSACWSSSSIRMEDSSMGWLPVPLVDPERLITVPASFKETAGSRFVWHSFGICARLGYFACVCRSCACHRRTPFRQRRLLWPRSWMGRAKFCRELLHQTSAGRLIDLSPNGLDFALASIDMRIFAILVCRTDEHAEAGC